MRWDLRIRTFALPDISVSGKRAPVGQAQARQKKGRISGLFWVVTAYQPNG